MAIFGAQDASGASFFDGIYDVFCTYLNIYTKKCNIKNYQEITKKQISPWCSAFLGSRPLPQTDPSQGPFLTVFAMYLCTSSTPQKRAAFLPRGQSQGNAACHAVQYARHQMPCASPDLKADAWQPGAGRRGAMLALCSPLLELSRPYVSRMLPQVGSMGPMLAHVGPMLALCWPNLALSCPYVGPLFAYVTPILPLCWPYVGVHWPYLALCWPYVGLSYPYVDPMFTYVGLPNPLPHSSDRKVGGDDGVGRGWRRGGERWVGGWGGTPLSGSAVLRRRPSHLWL